MDGIYKEKPAVANLGIMLFYNALEAQDCTCTQIEWVPPYKQSEEIDELLDECKEEGLPWISSRKSRKPTRKRPRV